MKKKTFKKLILLEYNKLVFYFFFNDFDIFFLHNYI